MNSFALVLALHAIAAAAILSPAAAYPLDELVAHGPNGERIVQVVEHATTDTIFFTNANQTDSIGNTLTFGNPLFDAKDETQIGRDAGHCVRAYPGEMWECRWTAYFDGHGSISIEGGFFDAKDSELAVTGGTGEFVGASGILRLGHRDKTGKSYDFTYVLNN